MSLLKEILRISDLMNINESLKTKNNIFDKFDIERYNNIIFKCNIFTTSCRDR